MTAQLPLLGRSALEALRAAPKGALEIPASSLLNLPERAVQFGTGGFLRGFVGDFLHRANQRGLFNGRLVAVGSTTGARDRAINEQDGLYTLVVEGIDKGQPVQQQRIISSMSRALSAADDWPAVLTLAREPLLEVVFSNTTEVGIALHPTDALDDAPPQSFPAKLTRFLFERARAFDFDASAGLVVIPCELIEDNGTRLKQITLQLTERWTLDPRFAAWLEAAVPFCNTLVDRIVPGSPSAGDAHRLAESLGYRDNLLTICEPYRQFAIEGDEMMKERLAWTRVDEGIIVAPHVQPYRERKLRLLNGTHTLLAPVALSMGLETVSEAMGTPPVARLVQQAMFGEIASVVEAAGAVDFGHAVVDRLRNPFIKHALVDITLHGTMKMRVRLVPVIKRWIERRGTVPPSLAFGFAIYLLLMDGRFQASRREQGLRVPPDDQAPHLESLWTRVPPDRMAPVDDLVRSVCEDVSLWGHDLSALPGFCVVVADHLWRARSQGVNAALEHHLSLSVV